MLRDGLLPPGGCPGVFPSSAPTPSQGGLQLQGPVLLCFLKLQVLINLFWWQVEQKTPSLTPPTPPPCLVAFQDILMSWGRTDRSAVMHWVERNHSAFPPLQLQHHDHYHCNLFYHGCHTSCTGRQHEDPEASPCSHSVPKTMPDSIQASSNLINKH